MDCLCLTARHAARTLTRFYDEALKPSGLTATQFGLLSLLHARPLLTQAQIAAMVDSDQTTLSRGMKLMVERRWICARPGADDARKMTYVLTRAGAKRRDVAMPLWEAVQNDMQARLGKRFDKAITLLQELAAA
jgi:DNA-binding MarR family transcriptional regulator